MGDATRLNGVLQIVTGVLCIALNAAIFVYMYASMDQLGSHQTSGAGFWGGAFLVISGIFVLLSGRYLVTALVINAVSLVVTLFHVIWMSISIMSDERQLLNPGSYKYPVYLTLFR